VNSREELVTGSGSDPVAGPPTLPDRIVEGLRRDVPLAILDLAIVVVAYLVPLVLRFDGLVPERYWGNFRLLLPIVVVLHLTSNYALGLYGQMWRYASVQEARRVVLAAGIAGVLIVPAGLYVGDSVRLVPISVLILGATLSLIGFGAVRFQSRLFAFRRRTRDSEPLRLLLMGAGDAGEMILRDIFRNESLALQPVGFVDDDPRKRGLSVHGVRVLGTRAAIPSLIESLRVDQVLLAVPSATGELVRSIAAVCQEAEVTLRVLPSVRELVGGRISVRDIRDLRIEDLLGRTVVETDMGSVATMIHGSRVLITGAGGSIGSEIARQVARFDPAGMVLLDHDETLLHDVLRSIDGDAEPVLADVRDRDRILKTLLAHRPDIVFHAAAHKHVDMLETHPQEAVQTNLLGTANVADAAMAADVRRFVLISTDKAVNPANVMGASKWLAEQVIRSLQDGACVFCAVRFGNVLGSRGSVVPTFLAQIDRGGPVTVTHPSMTRYFMSAGEAVQLVLQASALARGGEVFTLDMGDPVNILDLARNLIRLSGRVPEKEVEIALVGPRAGEKLAEDVIQPGENPVPSAHPAIIVSRPPPPARPTLRSAIRELEDLAVMGDDHRLAARMKELAGELPDSVAVGGGS